MVSVSHNEILERMLAHAALGTQQAREAATFLYTYGYALTCAESELRPRYARTLPHGWMVQAFDILPEPAASRTTHWRHVRAALDALDGVAPCDVRDLARRRSPAILLRVMVEGRTERLRLALGPRRLERLLEAAHELLQLTLPMHDGAGLDVAAEVRAILRTTPRP